MRYVELVPGVRSSALGFGCAPVLGSVDAARAGRAIHVALECGVNHFDLARSYGYGEAERFVGGILRSRRDEVVIATKFGIEATLAARLLRAAKPLIRALRPARPEGTAGKPPGAQKTAGSRLGRMLVRRIPLTPATLRANLERSLRALGTDRVEYLFVHEPDASMARADDLAAEAARLKDAGRIRGWGLAFYWAQRALHDTAFAHFDVLQCDISPGVAHYEEARRMMGARPAVFFSPFREATGPRDEVLSRLSADFPRAVILCSMFRENHIRSNAEAVAG